MLAVYAFSEIVCASLAMFYTTIVAQAVIDEIEFSHDFYVALSIAGRYFAIVAICTCVMLAIDNFYVRWKRQGVEGAIEQEIYVHALNSDQSHFEHADYLDSYKLATEEFVSRSSEAMEQCIKLAAYVVQFFMFTSLIVLRGGYVVAIIAGLALFAAWGQFTWSKVTATRSRLMVRPRRKSDYVRRLFFNQEMVAELKSSKSAEFINKLYEQSVTERIKTFKAFAHKEFIVCVLCYLSLRSTEFAVPIYVAWGIVSGKFEGIGVYATLIAASVAFKHALEGITWWSSQIFLHAQYAAQVQTFFQTQSYIEANNNGTLQPSSGPFHVEISDLSFSYPEGSFKLHIPHMLIDPGKRIAIVGRNGAGKSTLAKLLLRLYDPCKGDISINGHRLPEYDVKSLRHHVGVAFQSPTLYALTVRENMTVYGRRTDGELEQALCILDLPIALDQQYTKEFDDDGVLLSGGQAQKFGISRLLHGDFGLIILDEPSSALDPLAEAKLAELIFDNATTSTLMIAHRLATVRNADRIYVLDDGAIVESGTHDELMQQHGLYHQLFTKQARGYSENSVAHTDVS